MALPWPKAAAPSSPVADRTRLAAPNKYLTRSNKSRTGDKATKKRNRRRTGYAAHPAERRHKPVSPVSAGFINWRCGHILLPCAPGGVRSVRGSQDCRTDGAEKPPPDRKNRKGLLVGIAGGFLTAGAVVLALNGGVPFIKKGPTLSIVAPAEITDASKTLDPANPKSEQYASEAKKCSVPLAWVDIWKTPGASGGTIRIRSGDYISPPFTLTDAPQRVAIPFPAPYATGQGVLSVEGAANGAVISISPAWHINSLPGSASLDVVWTPKDPC